MTELIISIFAMLAGVLVNTMKDAKRFPDYTYFEYIKKHSYDVFSSILLGAVVIASDYKSPDILYCFAVGYSFNSGLNWAIKGVKK